MNRTLLWVIVILLSGYSAASVDELMAYRKAVAEVETVKLFDVSGENLQPPPSVADIIAKLERLGFTRLGEAASHTIADMRFWYLVDEQQTTVGTVFRFHGIPRATLATWFGDDACVAHVFPKEGDTDIRSNLYNRPVMAMPAKAYSMHRRQVAKFAARFGEPTKATDVADRIRREHLYIDKFENSEFRHQTLLMAANAVGSGLLAVGLVAHLFTTRRKSHSAPSEEPSEEKAIEEHGSPTGE